MTLHSIVLIKLIRVGRGFLKEYYSLQPSEQAEFVSILIELQWGSTNSNSYISSPFNVNSVPLIANLFISKNFEQMPPVVSRNEITSDC